MTLRGGGWHLNFSLVTTAHFGFLCDFLLSTEVTLLCTSCFQAPTVSSLEVAELEQFLGCATSVVPCTPAAKIESRSNNSNITIHCRLQQQQQNERGSACGRKWFRRELDRFHDRIALVGSEQEARNARGTFCTRCNPALYAGPRHFPFSAYAFGIRCSN